MGKKRKIPLAFFAYLGLLLFVLVSWRGQASAPPMYQRVLFILASLLPALLFQKTLLPIIACFSTISFYGYAHTYFPAEIMYILPIVAIVALFKRKQLANLKNGNLIVLFLAFYTAFIDFYTSGEIQPVSLSFFVVFLYEVMLDKDEIGFRIYGYALCIASLALSIEFYFVSDEMVKDYAPLGISRVMLRDPNYYGAIIAVGAVVAFREQLSNRTKSLFEKILYISTIVIIFITVILNASRGAMLSLSLCLLLLIMMYPTKTKYKVFVIVAASVGIFLLYQGGYFNLLQDRVASDSGTGSNRTVIWATKINTFIQKGSVLNLLFGFGHIDAMALGVNMAFHNDYLAMLVEYGIVGLILLLVLILRPLFLLDRKSLKEMAILILFFVVASSTIEPITSGRYPHLFFFIYIEQLGFLNVKINKQLSSNGNIQSNQSLGQ